MTRRGACGSVLCATVAGGPPNRPIPGEGGAGAGLSGAVSCETLAGPLASTPVRFSSHSCGASVGLTTEIASVLRSGLRAAKTSSG